MMRLVLGIVFAGVCLGQAKGVAAPPAQQAANCSQNITGNNNTGTLTCYGVDKKLADQIGQLVTASKRDAKTLRDISEQMDELLKKFQPPATGSVIQSNSGGVNVLQGTTGANSPIINSPVTIGKVPKTIPPDLADELVALLKAAPTKAKVGVMVDQLSGVEPLPDEFYDVLKRAGWPMAATGASHVMALYGPGRIPQGAEMLLRGSPPETPGNTWVGPEDPLFYLGTALQRLGINPSLRRQPNHEEGVITVSFRGGFPSP